MEPKRDPKTYAVIGAAMEVHRELGPGFLERAYQDALEIEFENRDIPMRREVSVPIRYKGRSLRSDYRADFICFDDLLIETKAQKALTDIDYAQVIHYLKATGFNIGLLLNFGERSLNHKRFVHSN
ncbi:MAG: GxxExxY protein [Planctomycetota bacterium]